MKKVLLLIMMCIPAVLAAQTSNGVKVSGLAVDAGTVTFNVSWDKNDMPEVWVDSAWVFVDYNNNGVMTRLPLLPGATLTEIFADGVGKVIEETGNNKGVWVVGNAKTANSGSFSAKVELFTEIKDIAGACAYASNYPPVGVFITEAGITFSGTPMYDILIEKAGEGTDAVQSNNPFLVPGNVTVLSFTDATGAPGIIITHEVYCDPGAVGDENTALPRCTSYSAGMVGNEGYYPTDCAYYSAGSIGDDTIE